MLEGNINKIETYLEEYGYPVERGEKEYIKKQMGSRVELIAGVNIITAKVKYTDKDEKIIRDEYTF